jgi:hypothetical protein
VRAFTPSDGLKGQNADMADFPAGDDRYLYQCVPTVTSTQAGAAAQNWAICTTQKNNSAVVETGDASSPKYANGPVACPVSGAGTVMHCLVCSAAGHWWRVRYRPGLKDVIFVMRYMLR